MSGRIGVDVGGTFTDVVFLGADGRFRTKKVPSSTDDYARAIAQGIGGLLEENALNADATAEISHGTTVASNAILENKGAKVGLITTRGFRDVIEIRDLRIPKLYDIAWEKPRPLVPRGLRHEIDERMRADGTVATPVDRASVERAVDALVAEGVEAIAICLVNSYANSAHEQEVEAIVRARADVLVSRSTTVLPEMKEYERTSTTVVNTYVMPVVSRYLNRLVGELGAAEIRAPVMLMQSNGGLTSLQAATRLPMNIIESGPAGGVIGAHALAGALGIGDVISFDMGGTTAKASLIEGGELARSPEFHVGGGILIGSRMLSSSGYLLKVPAIDLAEVGAGGGSIVSLDSGGGIRVGPESVGAVPGPVCYDAGGNQPSVTDANVILGYLNPEYLVGGDLRLNARKAHEVFAERIAEPLGMEVDRAAYGVFRIAAASMMRAIRAVSSERGRDPRRCTLVAFGGNGPLFAAEMAASLGIGSIIIPPSPGVFSAFGFLYADLEHHRSATVRAVLDQANASQLSAALAALEEEARSMLAGDGVANEAMEISFSATIRYVGQSYELPVPIANRSLGTTGLASLGEAFASEHERVYGHRAASTHPVEIVNLRVIGRAIRDKVDPRKLGSGRERAAQGERSRRVYFGPDTGSVLCPVIGRDMLETPREGPLIIEEYDSTCVVPVGAVVVTDEIGNIRITLQKGATPRGGH